MINFVTRNVVGQVTPMLTTCTIFHRG